QCYSRMTRILSFCCFFFNNRPTTGTYTLSLHDALPISFGAPHTTCCTSPVPASTSQSESRSAFGCGRTRSTRATTMSANPSPTRSEEHTSELQSRENLVCRLLLEKKKKPQTPSKHQHIQ